MECTATVWVLALLFVSSVPSGRRAEGTGGNVFNVVRQAESRYVADGFFG